MNPSPCVPIRRHTSALTVRGMVLAKVARPWCRLRTIYVYVERSRDWRMCQPEPFAQLACCMGYHDLDAA